MDTIHFETIASPIGVLTAAGDDSGLRWLLFAQSRYEPAREGWQQSRGRFTALREQLAAYFAGELRDFDLELAPVGTPFQRSVWDALRRIPYATTWSYRDLATDIGNPKAVRAVGLANGRNPLPIVVPCHRVIGSTGNLTGFGGGLPTKRWLLDHERRYAPRPPLQLR